MTEDLDHLPPLVIPPDHPSAVKLYDADALRWIVNDKLNAAVEASDPSQHDLRKAFEICEKEVASIIDDYIAEVGGKPGQKVDLTYKHCFPVVVGRSSGPTEH